MMNEKRQNTTKEKKKSISAEERCGGKCVRSIRFAFWPGIIQFLPLHWKAPSMMSAYSHYFLPLHADY
jgi:hypothetical protein